MSEQQRSYASRWYGAPAWHPSTPYRRGWRVCYNGRVWEAVQPNRGVEPTETQVMHDADGYLSAVWRPLHNLEML